MTSELTCFGVAKLANVELQVSQVRPLLYGDLVSSVKQVVYAIQNALFIHSQRKFLNRLS